MLALLFALPPALPTRSLVELSPVKGMLLARRWLASSDARNLVTTVPDGKKLKAVRAVQGDELARRALCKSELQRVNAATCGLAEADRSDYPTAKRQLVDALRVAGAPRGEQTQVFASLPPGRRRSFHSRARRDARACLVGARSLREPRGAGPARDC